MDSREKIEENERVVMGHSTTNGQGYISETEQRRVVKVGEPWRKRWYGWVGS